MIAYIGVLFPVCLSKVKVKLSEEIYYENTSIAWPVLFSGCTLILELEGCPLTLVGTHAELVGFHPLL